MERTYDLESDVYASENNLDMAHEATLKITIDIQCHSDDGDIEFEVLSIRKPNGDFIDKPSEALEAEVEKFADQCAYDDASDAYQDWIEGGCGYDEDAVKEQIEDAQRRSSE